MKRAIFILVIVLLSSHASYARGGGSYGYSSRSLGSRYVKPSFGTTRGYIKSNGAYVGGYKHTTKDTTRNNNYSAKGNVNPWKGQVGSK